jgi:hypothetical protein
VEEEDAVVAVGPDAFRSSSQRAALAAVAAVVDGAGEVGAEEEGEEGSADLEGAGDLVVGAVGRVGKGNCN